MKNTEFREIRAELGKTQKEMAQLLGVSIKAVHSYEQGWRNIPHYVEKQMLFLLFKRRSKGESIQKCWDILKCPMKKRARCPAWEFDAGDLCWFINGTICSTRIHGTWQEKIEECRTCKVFLSFFSTFNTN